MLIVLYMQHLRARAPRNPTSMDLFMVCSCIVILMGLLALLGLGVMVVVSGAVVEPAPYPLQIAAYAIAACVMSTLAMGLTLWAHYEEGTIRVRTTMIDATYAGRVVIGRPV